ncbi:Hypothetical protein HDN1F_25560 [gamma proteobacterium HdN1]|nr:Hypothetical protein HDN1F_25560 [gamma proteobacterium HdN1]
MKFHSHELPLPPQIDHDPDAIEVLRLWQSGTQHHVSMNPKLEGKPENFGAALAQLAIHSASIHAKHHKISTEEALRRIIHGYKNELASKVSG